MELFKIKAGHVQLVTIYLHVFLYMYSKCVALALRNVDLIKFPLISIY